MTSRVERFLKEVHHRSPSEMLSMMLRWAEAHNDSELATWIRLESLGYWESNPVMTERTVVPEYRTVAGEWFDVYGRPLILTDPNLAFVNETRRRSGVAELESFATAAGTLALPNPGHSDIIREHLGVEVSTFRFSPRALPPVLAAIRAQLVVRLAQTGVSW